MAVERAYVAERPAGAATAWPDPAAVAAPRSQSSPRSHPCEGGRPATPDPGVPRRSGRLRSCCRAVTAPRRSRCLQWSGVLTMLRTIRRWPVVSPRAACLPSVRSAGLAWAGSPPRKRRHREAGPACRVRSDAVNDFTAHESARIPDPSRMVQALPLTRRRCGCSTCTPAALADLWVPPPGWSTLNRPSSATRQRWSATNAGPCSDRPRCAKKNAKCVPVASMSTHYQSDARRSSLPTISRCCCINEAALTAVRRSRGATIDLSPHMVGWGTTADRRCSP